MLNSGCPTVATNCGTSDVQRLGSMKGNAGLCGFFSKLKKHFQWKIQSTS